MGQRSSSGAFFWRSTKGAIALCFFLEEGHRPVLGVDVMTDKSRSFLRVSVVPHCCSVAPARSHRPLRGTGPIPRPGRTARCRSLATRSTIGHDKDVILDVSPPALAGLSIDGKLTFADDADLELTTEWIMLHGELAIGSEASPVRTR